MRTLEIKAGERVRVLKMIHHGIPTTVVFDAESAGGPPTGRVHVHAFLGGTTERALEPHNRIEKKWLQSNFAIEVEPDRDTTIRFRTRHITADVLYWTFAVLIAVALVSGLYGVLVGY